MSAWPKTLTSRRDSINSFVSHLPRHELVKALENISIQCYDSESDQVLEEALAVNIEDGTTSIPDVNELLGR